MAIKITIFAADEAERRLLGQSVLEGGSYALAGGPLPLAAPFAGGDGLARQVRSQSPDVILVAVPGGGEEDVAAVCALVTWLREQAPQAAVVAIGPVDSPGVIVAAMRAGACEYLERPLRASALAEALARARGGPTALARPRQRGKLLAILGARGGVGATTVAVNLALALQAERRQAEAPVLLLDAAPLGHACLQLNLKPQFTLADLLGHSARLDVALLQTLVCHCENGLEVLAGAMAPLATVAAASTAAHTWLDLLLAEHPWTVVDLSTRLDALAQAILERADRVCLVAQTDMVSLWSAAKVRQYLDPAGGRKFEMILNRFGATPAANLDEVASITQTTLLAKLPDAHAQVQAAIERGYPPALKGKSELARSFRALAAQLLGRPPVKRGWLPFLRAHAVES